MSWLAWCERACQPMWFSHSDAGCESAHRSHRDLVCLSGLCRVCDERVCHDCAVLKRRKEVESCRRHTSAPVSSFLAASRPQHKQQGKMLSKGEDVVFLNFLSFSDDHHTHSLPPSVALTLIVKNHILTSSPQSLLFTSLQSSFGEIYGEPLSFFFFFLMLSPVSF